MKPAYLRYDGPGYGQARRVLANALGKWETVPDPGWLKRNAERIFFWSSVAVVGALGVWSLLSNGTPDLLMFAGAFAMAYPLALQETMPQYLDEDIDYDQQFQVHLSFLKGDTLLARDSGILWLYRSRLGYLGYRSKFDIPKGEVDVQVKGKQVQLLLPSGICVRVDFSTPWGPLMRDRAGLHKVLVGEGQ